MYKYEIYPQIRLTETMPAEDSLIRHLIEKNNKITVSLNKILSKDNGLSFEEKITLFAEDEYEYSIYIVKKEYDDETGEYLNTINVKLFDLSATTCTGTTASN